MIEIEDENARAGTVGRQWHARLLAVRTKL
jgi:hypothetical protein